MKTVNKFQLS